MIARPRMLAGVGLLLTLAAADIALAQCPDGTPPPCGRRLAVVSPGPAARIAYRQLTSSGAAAAPAISPNGAFLAYAESGNVRVRSLAAGGSAITILAADTTTGRPWRLEWSEDVSRVVVYTDRGVSIVPSLGGTPQRLPGSGPTSVVSPKGDRVLYWAMPVPFVLIRRLASGGLDTVRVPGRYRFVLEAPVWAPVGDALVILTADGEGKYTLRQVALRGGAGRVLLEDSVPITSVVWPRGSGAIYYVRAPGRTNRQLWKLPVPASAAAATRPRLVAPMFDGAEFSISDDGTLAYARRAETGNVFEAGLAGDSARRWLSRGTSLPLDARYAPDGRSAALVRSEGAASNLWLDRGDGRASEQLTLFEEGEVGDLAWSADGRRIAVCLTGEARPGILVVSVIDRTVQRLATRGVSGDCDVEWLSGDAIVYQRPGNRNFAIHSLRGLPERDLLSNDSVGWIFSPRADPAGRILAVAWNRPPVGIWLVSPADSSQRALLPEFRGTPVRWAADGASLFVRRGAGLQRVPVAAPDSAVPMGLPSGCPFPADISPDGRRVLCLGWSSSSDIWLIQHFDPTWPARAPARR